MITDYCRVMIWLFPKATIATPPSTKPIVLREEKTQSHVTITTLRLQSQRVNLSRSMLLVSK